MPYVLVGSLCLSVANAGERTEHMYRSRARNKTTQWIRIALKCGLLVTDRRLWDAVGHLLREEDGRRRRSSSAYENAPAHEELVSEARHRHSHAPILLGGIGIGVGVGILLAPTSGEKARSVIRKQAVAVKDTVADLAGWASQFGRAGKSTMREASTGTYGG